MLDMKKTYWNHNGRFEEESDILGKLVPMSGEAGVEHIDVFRQISNLYHENYNNGLCNVEGPEYRGILPLMEEVEHKIEAFIAKYFPEGSPSFNSQTFGMWRMIEKALEPDPYGYLDDDNYIAFYMFDGDKELEDEFNGYLELATDYVTAWAYSLHVKKAPIFSADGTHRWGWPLPDNWFAEEGITLTGEDIMDMLADLDGHGLVVTDGTMLTERLEDLLAGMIFGR